MIRRMFREIDAECYIMVDGDDTYPAEYGWQMADLVHKRQVDMVVRDRLPSTFLKRTNAHSTIWETRWCAVPSTGCLRPISGIL